jgi:signal transduction histidine kinase
VSDHKEQLVGALRSPLELKAALRLLSGIVLETIDADHVSIFLLEEGGLLPAVALRREPSPEDWQAMKALGPIRLTRKRAETFARGDPVLIDDVRSNGLVPSEITEQFALRSMAMVAMQSDGTTCGVLAVGRDQVRPFSAGEGEVLRSLAAHAARAVVEAHPFESVRRRARLQGALARGSARLAEPLDDVEIASRLVDAYGELLDPGICAVALVDDDQFRMTTLVASGPIERPVPIPLNEVPSSLVRQVRDAWLVTGGPGPVEIEDEPWVDKVLGSRRAGVGRHLLLPLVVEERIRGAVVIGLRGQLQLDAEAGAAAQTMAAIGTAALERGRLLGRLARQVRQLETLHRLRADLAEGADTAALLNRLNEALKDHGVEVVGLALRDRRLTRHLRVPVPTIQERVVWEDGRWLALEDGTQVVPLSLDGRPAGVLRVRAEVLDRPERLFVEALGNGLVEVASRAALRHALDDAERARALDVERTRLAHDLHDTVGQLFVTIHLLAGRLGTNLAPPSSEYAEIARIAELAAEGKRSLDDAIRALAFAPASKRSLPSALAALGRAVEHDSGITVSLTVGGRHQRLLSEVERALYRVAHEALTNAWRHSGCKQVRMALAFASSEVILRVEDDGSGIDGATSLQGPQMGLASMRRAMGEVGGSLEVASSASRGWVVEARVPRRVP